MGDMNRIKSHMTPEESVDSTIGALEIAAEAGDWALVQFMLSKGSARLIDSDAGPKGQDVVKTLRQRLADALKCEEIHGKGSLLNPDHPFNSQMAEIAEAQRGKPTEIYLQRWLRK